MSMFEGRKNRKDINDDDGGGSDDDDVSRVAGRGACESTNINGGNHSLPLLPFSHHSLSFNCLLSFYNQWVRDVWAEEQVCLYAPRMLSSSWLLLLIGGNNGKSSALLIQIILSTLESTTFRENFLLWEWSPDWFMEQHVYGTIPQDMNANAGRSLKWVWSGKDIDSYLFYFFSWWRLVVSIFVSSYCGESCIYDYIKWKRSVFTIFW